MKIKYLLSVVISFFLMANVVNGQGIRTLTTKLAGDTAYTDAAHDTVYIPVTISSGNLENVITGDTTAAGARVNPNTVYLLQAGGVYLQNAGWIYDGTGTITLMGPANQAKPVLRFQPLNSLKVYASTVNGSDTANKTFTGGNLTLKNLEIQCLCTDNTFLPDHVATMSGRGTKLDVEDCLILTMDQDFILSQSVSSGFKVVFKNNYFRDFFDGSQWWEARAWYCKNPIDTFIFENNTAFGPGLLCLSQNSLIQFAVVDHNTIINSIKYPFLDSYYLTGYFTNNLFVNIGLAGEDKPNVQEPGGQDPDGLPMGIIGVDTLDKVKGLDTAGSLGVQPIYLASRANGGTYLDSSKLGLSHIKWFASNNIVVADTGQGTPLYAYLHGNPNDGLADSACSYLTWEGLTGPFGVVNICENLTNSRGYNLAKDHKNIKFDKNHEYTWPVNYLGLTTTPLDTEAAAMFIQWNRGQYSCPNAVTPVTYATPIVTSTGKVNPSPEARFNIGGRLGGMYGGEFPGFTAAGGTKTENATIGITLLSDVQENWALKLSVTDSFLSTIDGLPIGSTVWYPGTSSIPYTIDFADELAKIENAYLPTGVNTATEAAAVTVSNFPNPFSSSTTIKITLPVPTHAKLTVLDVSGKVIATLIDADELDGTTDVTFAPAGLSDGVYIFVLTTNESVVTGKFVKN